MAALAIVMADLAAHAPRCSTCRFWQQSYVHPDRTVQPGECRIHPPKSGPSRFPLVSSEEWCGEHKPIPGSKGGE